MKEEEKKKKKEKKKALRQNSQRISSEIVNRVHANQSCVGRCGSARTMTLEPVYNAEQAVRTLSKKEVSVTFILFLLPFCILFSQVGLY